MASRTKQQLRGRALAAALVILCCFVVARVMREGGSGWPWEAERGAPGAPATPAADADLLRELARELRSVPRPVRVRTVVDGDTVRLAGGGRVRFVGIDAPEQGEPGYAAARAANRRLIESGAVVALTLPDAGVDAYRRELAALFVTRRGPQEDGVLSLNRALVREGLAWVYDYGNDALSRALVPRLLAAQNAAIDERRGLWSNAAALEGEVWTTTRRFHRAGCSHLEQSSHPLRAQREHALRSGRSPCRTCKP